MLYKVRYDVLTSDGGAVMRHCKRRHHRVHNPYKKEIYELAKILREATGRYITIFTRNGDETKAYVSDVKRDVVFLAQASIYAPDGKLRETLPITMIPIDQITQIGFMDPVFKTTTA